MEINSSFCALEDIKEWWFKKRGKHNIRYTVLIRSASLFPFWDFNCCPRPLCPEDSPFSFTLQNKTAHAAPVSPPLGVLWPGPDCMCALKWVGKKEVTWRNLWFLQIKQCHSSWLHESACVSKLEKPEAGGHTYTFSVVTRDSRCPVERLCTNKFWGTFGRDCSRAGATCGNKQHAHTESFLHIKLLNFSMIAHRKAKTWLCNIHICKPRDICVCVCVRVVKPNTGGLSNRNNTRLGCFYCILCNTLFMPCSMREREGG